MAVSPSPSLILYFLPNFGAPIPFFFRRTANVVAASGVYNNERLAVYWDLASHVKR